MGIFAFWILVSGAGFLTHYFFVFPWLASLHFSWSNLESSSGLHLAVCVTRRLCYWPWYVRVSESLAGWRITKDWLKWRPSHFNYVTVMRDVVFNSSPGMSDIYGRARPNMEQSARFIRSWALPPSPCGRSDCAYSARDRLFLAILFAVVCAGPFAFDVLQHTYTISLPRYASQRCPQRICWPRRARLLRPADQSCHAFSYRYGMDPKLSVLIASDFTGIQFEKSHGWPRLMPSARI